MVQRDRGCSPQAAPGAMWPLNTAPLPGAPQPYPPTLGTSKAFVCLSRWPAWPADPPGSSSHLAAMGRDDAQVSRDPVPALHLHQVPNHHVLRVDLDLLALADHQGLLPGREGAASGMAPDPSTCHHPPLGTPRLQGSSQSLAPSSCWPHHRPP